MTPGLTIAIPTYNRSEPLALLIQQIMDHDIHALATIAVFDDGSVCRDTNSAFFSSLPASTRIVYQSCTVNRGYARALLHLFRACRTEFIMLMADDDLLVADQIRPLIEFLESQSPDFLSSQCLLGDKDDLLRGKSARGPVRPEAFFGAAAHAPGLVYRVSACAAGLEVLDRRLTSEGVESLIYPQVVLLATLLLQDKDCQWYPKPLVREWHGLPSGISDKTGDSYAHLESRWRQLKAFDDLFASLTGFGNEAVLTTLIAANHNRIFGHLISAMEMERPAFKREFDRSAYKYYIKRAIKSLLSPIRRRPQVIR